MPYDPIRDQYYWLGKGYIDDKGVPHLPSQDGTGFLPNAPSPKLSDAFRVLARHASLGTGLKGVVVGKMYKGRSAITGIPFVSDMGSLASYATGTELKSDKERREEQRLLGGTFNPSPLVGGGTSTEEKIALWLGLKEIPEKIVGIYFEIQD